MHYQLYVPKTADTWPTLEGILPARWLSGVNQVETHSGPDGGAGRVFSWPTPSAPENQYLPDRYKWVAGQGGRLPGQWSSRAAAGGYWVGLRKGSPPTPEDLALPERFAGRELTLGDGQVWTVPAAAKLPRAYRLRDGIWTSEVRAEFRMFWDDSVVWFERSRPALEGRATSIVAPPEWIDYVLSALALNYRLLPEVASELGLLGTDNAFDAILATVSGHLLLEVAAEKKSPDAACTPAGSNTSSGEPG